MYPICITIVVGVARKCGGCIPFAFTLGMTGHENNPLRDQNNYSTQYRRYSSHFVFIGLSPDA